MQTVSPENKQMFGCDPEMFLASVKDSLTYKFNGAYMVAASLMSDAQEEIAMGADEAARLTLNRAKLVLFAMGEGKLVPIVTRDDKPLN